MHTRRMDPNTPRENSWPDQPDTYWRRRVFALAAGIGVLGLLAWACSGALGGARPPTRTASPYPAAQQGPASSSRPAVASSPAAAATVTVTATPSRRPRSAAHGSAQASPSPGASASPRAAAAARPPGGRCAPGDVVPSLFVSQQVYQRLVKPQFSIYLVNIGRTTCTFDVGAKSLRLVVRSGQVRVWGSADCVRGAAPNVVRLRRGVPFVTQVSWSRHQSSQGCGPDRPEAAPGTYSAAVSSGAVHSHTEVFVLR